MLHHISVPFADTTLTVQENRKAPCPAAGECPTGCLVWPASLSCLSLLASLDPTALHTLAGSASFLDLSAGVGLTSLALAHLCGPSGRVLSLDTPTALPLLSSNLRCSGRVAVHAYAWGEALPLHALGAGSPPLSLALACDLLYCAVRDGRAAELARTLAALARAARLGALVVWQPRRGEEELALLAEAARLCGAAPCAPLRLRAQGQHRGVGHPDGAIFLPPSLFPEALEGGEGEGESEGAGDQPSVLCALLRPLGAPELALPQQ